MPHPVKEILWIVCPQQTAAQRLAARELQQRRQMRIDFMDSSSARLKKLASLVRHARGHFRRTGQGLQLLQTLETEQSALRMEYWYDGVYADCARLGYNNPPAAAAIITGATEEEEAGAAVVGSAVPAATRD
jgi:hypothetical protein